MCPTSPSQLCVYSTNIMLRSWYTVLGHLFLYNFYLGEFGDDFGISAVSHANQVIPEMFFNNIFGTGNRTGTLRSYWNMRGLTGGLKTCAYKGQGVAAHLTTGTGDGAASQQQQWTRCLRLVAPQVVVLQRLFRNNTSLPLNWCKPVTTE